MDSIKYLMQYNLRCSFSYAYFDIISWTREGIAGRSEDH
jgi:hypothetical protein